MKRVVLQVPDEMIRTVGSSRHSRRIPVTVTAESLIRALEMADYHEAYLFERGTVTVVTVEDVEEE